MADEYTVGVHRVPNRTDGVVSLHVGPSFVLLSPDEVRALAIQMMSQATGQEIADLQVMLRAPEQGEYKWTKLQHPLQRTTPASQEASQ